MYAHPHMNIFSDDALVLDACPLANGGPPADDAVSHPGEILDLHGKHVSLNLAYLLHVRDLIPPPASAKLILTEPVFVETPGQECLHLLNMGMHALGWRSSKIVHANASMQVGHSLSERRQHKGMAFQVACPVMTLSTQVCRV